MPPEETTAPRPLEQRVAGAPISWGVCEVPDWGYQFEPDRVLREMRALGLAATEFGPIGFLEADPKAKARQLEAHGLRAVGGFLPVTLHDPAHDPLPAADTFIDSCLAAGAAVVVLAAFSGADGYDARPVLDELGWKTLLANLDRLSDHADSRGVVAALHPHLGTMVETAEEVERVVKGSHVGLCVDTGHLAAGGCDPVAFTEAYPDRIRHVHLKDVDLKLVDRVRTRDLAFGDAVRAGIFRPLGEGDLDIASLVRALERAGYQGWYVVEQDVRFDAEPQGDGPAANVRESLDFLRGVAV